MRIEIAPADRHDRPSRCIENTQPCGCRKIAHHGAIGLLHEVIGAGEPTALAGQDVGIDLPRLNHQSLGRVAIGSP